MKGLILLLAMTVGQSQEKKLDMTAIVNYEYVQIVTLRKKVADLENQLAAVKNQSNRRVVTSDAWKNPPKVKYKTLGPDGVLYEGEDLKALLKYVSEIPKRLDYSVAPVYNRGVTCNSGSS